MPSVLVRIVQEHHPEEGLSHEAPTPVQKGQLMSNQHPQYNERGQVVGVIKETVDTSGWVLEKHMQEKHHNRKPEGWATDKKMLENLRILGGDERKEIRLVIGGEHPRKLTATLSDFDKFGRPFDRNHGEQIVLPDKYWHDASSPQMSFDFLGP